MIDPGVAEAHGEIEPALAGGDHAPTLQPFEGHVPQPRRIVAVGDAGVDRHDHGLRCGRQHVEGLVPAGRVLGQQQPDLGSRDRGGAIAAGDVTDSGELGRGAGGIGSHRLRRGEGDGGVRSVDATRKRQLQGHAHATRQHHVLVVEVDVRVGADEIA